MKRILKMMMICAMIPLSAMKEEDTPLCLIKNDYRSEVTPEIITDSILSKWSKIIPVKPYHAVILDYLSTLSQSSDHSALDIESEKSQEGAASLTWNTVKEVYTL